MTGDPVARLDVESYEMGMHLLLFRDESAHQRRPDRPAEDTDAVEECREGEHPVWRLEATTEERLQDQRGDEPDERERLTDCHQELGPEVVLGCPHAGELSVDQAHRANRREAEGHQQPRIDSSVQQMGSEDGQEHLRGRSPQDRRTILRRLETSNRKGQRYDESRRQQHETEREQRRRQNDRVPFTQIRQINQWVWRTYAS